MTLQATDKLNKLSRDELIALIGQLEGVQARSLLCLYREACLTWRDTAPIRRLTLVYPPATAPSLHLAISPLLPMTSPFTVEVHPNIFFYSSDWGWMSKFTSTPGQPHRVAPTITRNGKTTEGLRPVCIGSLSR